MRRPIREGLARLGTCILLALPLMACRTGTIKDKPLPAPGGMTVLKEGTMDYGLFTPAGVDPSRKYPLVVYLHGYTEKPLINEPWQVAGLQELEPCFVLIPTCPESDGASAWGGTYDPDFRPSMRTVLAILDRVVKERPVDPHRLYAYGNSMGGEGIFMLLAMEPGRFAGAISVAGYTLEKGAANMAKTPLWILHGSNDTVNATDSSRKIYAAIQAAGGRNVRYTEYPGADHATIWDLARREPGLMAWLLAQRR